MCLTMAVAMTMGAAFLVGCSDDDDNGKHAAPTLTLKGGDIKAVHEIKPTMSVVVDVTAPAGLSDLTVKIESPCLTAEVLGELGLAQTMSLVNPATPEIAAGLKELEFPVGDDVKNKTSLSINISQLVPLIAVIYNQDSNHNFVLTATDADNQKSVETLKFHLTPVVQ